MADCTYPKCQQTAIPGCQGLCRDLSVNRRATDGQRDTARGVPEGWKQNWALVPTRAIRAEISLIRTDPDSTLSEGAVRALRYIDAAMIAAAPTPPDGGHTVRRWGFCGTCRHSTIPGEACGRTDCPDGDAEPTDTQRLDFLDRHAVIAKPGQPIRDAIDAAMAASKGEKA